MAFAAASDTRRQAARARGCPLPPAGDDAAEGHPCANCSCSPASPWVSSAAAAATRIRPRRVPRRRHRVPRPRQDRAAPRPAARTRRRRGWPASTQRAAGP